MYRRPGGGRRRNRKPPATRISAAAAQVAHTLSVAAIVTYTTSAPRSCGSPRERPETPILCMTSKIETARYLLVWGTIA